MKKSLRFTAILLTAVLLITSTASAKSTSVKGIDVSKHNGTVDWSQVARQDIDFVMIKTGDGSQPEDFSADIDPQFEANYIGAKEAGIKRGAYHLCCTRTPEGAELEARYCLAILNGRELEYPVAYDMEQAGTFAGGIENTTEIALAFCKIIEEAGYTPMIYSSSSRLSNDFDWSRLKGYKVWAAHYDVEEPSLSIPFDIWQYTQSGDIAGANTNNGSGSCDLNYSFMEAESLAFSKSRLTLGRGESFRLSISMTPEGCTDTVTYSSSKKSVATVSRTGTVTAKAAGKTVITASSTSGCTASVTITVKPAPKSVKLNKTSLSLKTGKSFQLKPVLTKGSASNKITYTSNHKSIADVSSTGLVKARKKGTAVVTVKTFNGKTAKITVTVK